MPALSIEFRLHSESRREPNLSPLDPKRHFKCVAADTPVESGNGHSSEGEAEQRLTNPSSRQCVFDTVVHVCRKNGFRPLRVTGERTLEQLPMLLDRFGSALIGGNNWIAKIPVEDGVMRLDESLRGAV